VLAGLLAGGGGKDLDLHAVVANMNVAQRRYWRAPLSVVLAVAFVFLPPAHAQDVGDRGAANYVYSVFTGTGKYEVDDRTIYVVRMPLTLNWRKADHVEMKPGFRMLLPVAVGVSQFENILDIPGFTLDDLQTMTVVPGVEVDIPLTRNWALKPFAQAGWGWDLKDSRNSFVWGLGARTRAQLGERGEWLFGGEALTAGNEPGSDGSPTRFVRWMFGLEYKWQTDWAPFGRRVSLHPRLTQRLFSNELELQPPVEETLIRWTTEVGASVGIDPPINILGYKLSQAGVAYEFGDKLRAIKLITKFPF